MKKATRSEKQGSQSQGKTTTARQSRAPTKIARVLAHMLDEGPLHRFEAEHIGDHCLPSTISNLSLRYGLTFKRAWERVPSRWGTPCDVIRFSIPRSERRHAREVLALLTNRKPKRAAR